MCLSSEGTPSVTFGYSNEHYVKANSSGGNHTAATIEGNESLWAIDFTDVKLNGTSIASDGGKAIIDTATYAIQLDSAAYGEFKK